MNLLLLTFFTFSVAFAHDDHDWRLDYEAYLNVRTEVRPVIKMRQERAPSRIDMEFFKEMLTAFTAINRKRQEDLDISRAMLMEEYRKLGFEVSLHNFGAGSNVVAEKKGTQNPLKVLILSSHIDSVGNKGANDNGTGTIGALAIAKVLAKSEFPYTIRILGFDREETGLKGSDAYVATLLDKSQVVGNINLEMIGYHSKNDGGFHLIDCDKPILWNVSRKESEFLSAEVKNSIQVLGLDLNVIKTCTGRSDHASFWRAKIPAIVISENFFGGDADPCYHARCDVLDERLNYPYIQRILDAVLHATEIILKKDRPGRSELKPLILEASPSIRQT